MQRPEHMTQLMGENIDGGDRRRFGGTEYCDSLTFLGVATHALKLARSLEYEMARLVSVDVTIEDHADVVVSRTDNAIKNCLILT